MIELVRTDGTGEHLNPERLIKVLGTIAAQNPYLVPKLHRLHDHEGCLTVESYVVLTQQEQALIASVWCDAFGECLLTFKVHD